MSCSGAPKYIYCVLLQSISSVFECALVHRGVRETTNFTQTSPGGSMG